MPPKIQKTKENQAFPLNERQMAAAYAPLGPLLIVAGAGTGKTRTLTSRIIHLVENGTQPERICAITFTNKAAGEMKERVARAGYHSPFIGTFHSLGARILRAECRSFGRTPNFAIFDDHDSFDLIKKIFKGFFPKEEKGPKKMTPAFFANEIGKIKNLDVPRSSSPGASSSRPDEQELIATFFAKYEDSLARNNAFDFDDLIQKPVALFKKIPAALVKYQSRFDAVLVDEYQDINPKQYEFVKLLAGAHKNLSVVGDDEQTIYSWRYANIRTFLDFDKDWPGARIYFLEENYRSTKNIIRAAAGVAEHNRFRTPKKLFTNNHDGETIPLFEAWGENDEALWVADRIAELRGADADAEIAILYRTNAQSRAIEQALIRADIPYEIFGGVKFYERREVKDAIAALRWASNPKDEVARERLEKNLTKRKFALFKVKIGGAENLTPSATLKIFLETFGYFDYLEANFINSDEREENIGELISFAADFKELPDFLEKMSLLQATDDLAGGNAGMKKIKLMTIHLAKGLEFENVFVIGAAEGLLPHIRSIDNEDSLEEERRLMYVAMTRAERRLHISFYGMPSRFIAEIPDGLMDAQSVGDEEGEEDAVFID